MPQIVQLPLIFASQLFWLAVVFGIIYFVIAKGMVPKIQGVVEDRDRKIADDLAAAQKAREQAEASEEVYRQRIDTGRGEALKAEYEKKAKAADKEAASIVERARHEADTIVAQAKENAEALVERRQRIAEDKIAAEERAAVDKLRATAADAAREAAARIIRERVDAKADEALVGDAIRSIGGR